MRIEFLHHPSCCPQNLQTNRLEPERCFRKLCRRWVGQIKFPHKDRAKRNWKKREGERLSFQDTVDEGTKFQLFKNLAELFFVRLFADKCVHVELDRYVHFDGCKEFEKAIISRFASTLVLSAPFSRSVWASRFSMLPNSATSFCAVFSHARTAGDVIGRVAHQSQHVDDLLCGLDIELRFYLSMPMTSNPPLCLGRYMNTFSDTSWP